MHWSTDHASWDSAQVYIDVYGTGRNFNSIWKHDWDGRKHLSTIEQLSSEYFPAGSYMPGYPIDLHLKYKNKMLNLEQSSGIVGFFMGFLKNTCMLINRNLSFREGKI